MIPNAKKRKIHEEPIEDSSDSDSSFEDHIDYETTFSTRLVSTVVKNTNTPPTKAKLAIVEKLSAARNALHVSAHVAAMVGRETEYESIMRFFKECLAGKKGGSLYISGNPGTGKSRAVTLALAELAAQAEVSSLPSQLFLECESSGSSGVVQSIYELLSGTQSKKSGDGDEAAGSDDEHDASGGKKASQRKKMSAKEMKRILEKIETLARSSSGSIVILDEIDYLIRSKESSLLEKIYEWPFLPDSKLIIVGIANTLDLPNRELANLALKNISPPIVSFRSYENNQLSKIVQSRLAPFQPPLMEPKALDLLASKVATEFKGDARRMLQLCMSCLSEKEKAILAAGEMPVPATVGISDAKKVIAHLSKMTQSGSAAFISALPIHAQLGLIAAYNLEKEKRKAKDPTLNDLHARYKALAQSIGVQSEEFAKFKESSDMSQTYGLLRYEGGKANPKAIRVFIGTDLKELTTALKDHRLLSSLLPTESAP